jgi:ABC-type xylose transport system permease subunit
VTDTCECGNELSGSIKCGEFLKQLQTRFSRRALLHGMEYMWYNIITTVVLGLSVDIALHFFITHFSPVPSYLTTLDQVVVAKSSSRPYVHFLRI